MRSSICAVLLHLTVIAVVCLPRGADAFVPPQNQQGEQQVVELRMADEQDEAPSDPPANLVGKDAFVAAIDVLRRETGVEADPEEESTPKMYAIGRLEASLPLEMVSGISLADCETMTLVNGLHPSVAEATGIQPLDTIVSISAEDEGKGKSFSGDTSGRDIDFTAKVYTEAIEFAMEKGLKEIGLEMNRLVTLQATGEGPINGS